MCIVTSVVEVHYPLTPIVTPNLNQSRDLELQLSICDKVSIYISGFQIKI